ncbi:hypothetical protein AALO_G00096980 [Alosa alosa]|uniref:Myb-like domain-containing protein n=1 Tax=Alosa alosa TaxID=278164 RepID=A0AAV6GUT3_9TELE|nr:hypothetical protein AALO_G00096980 [Alosa alosa]
MAAAATAGGSPEEQPHNWTNEETRALIQWRADNEKLFTGRRNSSKNGWEVFVSTASKSLLNRPERSGTI